LHLARIEVEAGGLRHEHAHVAVLAEHRAQRVGHLRRRERARGHLIGERLKEVEVAPVDERDLDLRAAKLHGSMEAAEAAAHDHHPVRRHVGHVTAEAKPERRRVLSRRAGALLREWAVKDSNLQP
jgi:hypothetical protein